MRELMLELLTWAPFKNLVSGEKEYIDEILSGNYQQPNPSSMIYFQVSVIMSSTGMPTKRNLRT